jgi:hypothetical protein
MGKKKEPKIANGPNCLTAVSMFTVGLFWACNGIRVVSN